MFKAAQNKQVLYIPTFHILSNASAIIQYYINEAKGEISGLGTIYALKGGDYLIKDIHLFKQTTGPSITKLNPQDIANFMTDLITEDIDIGPFKVWWHSHGHGDVFWSERDQTTIESFNNDWMVSIVGNKRGHQLARLDVFNPRISVDLELVPHFSVTPQQAKILSGEVEQKVIYQQPPPPKPKKN